MFRRFLAFTLVFVMALSSMPLGAFAGDITPEEDAFFMEENVIIPEENISDPPDVIDDANVDENNLQDNTGIPIDIEPEIAPDDTNSSNNGELLPVDINPDVAMPSYVLEEVLKEGWAYFKTDSTAVVEVYSDANADSKPVFTVNGECIFYADAVEDGYLHVYFALKNEEVLSGWVKDDGYVVSNIKNISDPEVPTIEYTLGEDASITLFVSEIMPVEEETDETVDETPTNQGNEVEEPDVTDKVYTEVLETKDSDPDDNPEKTDAPDAVEIVEAINITPTDGNEPGIHGIRNMGGDSTVLWKAVVSASR